MEWTDEALQAVSRVPFFVRKRVKRRVEEETRHEGGKRVTLNDVDRTRKRFLNKMDTEIRGYQLDGCFGTDICPHRAVEQAGLMERLEAILSAADLVAFLRRHVDGPLKFHHEFRVTISYCPNSCSQPQIKDVGIIGARMPATTEKACTGCGACAAACQESAVCLDGDYPVIHTNKCVFCGKCADACPEGVITDRARGFRIQLGGKLGRHPLLARELDGIYTMAETAAILERCLHYYKEHSTQGQRFAEVLDERNDDLIGELNDTYGKNKR